MLKKPWVYRCQHCGQTLTQEMINVGSDKIWWCPNKDCPAKWANRPWTGALVVVIILALLGFVLFACTRVHAQAVVPVSVTGTIKLAPFKPTYFYIRFTDDPRAQPVCWVENYKPGTSVLAVKVTDSLEVNALWVRGPKKGEPCWQIMVFKEIK